MWTLCALLSCSPHALTWQLKSVVANRGSVYYLRPCLVHCDRHASALIHKQEKLEARAKTGEERLELVLTCKRKKLQQRLRVRVWKLRFMFDIYTTFCTKCRRFDYHAKALTSTSITQFWSKPLGVYLRTNIMFANIRTNEQNSSTTNHIDSILRRTTPLHWVTWHEPGFFCL